MSLRPLRGFGCATAVLAAAAVIALANPDSAPAYDSYPCGKQITVDWSSEPVQPCPLTDPLGPYCVYPLYEEPVSSPEGGPYPPPDAWLVCTKTQYFVCDRAHPAAMYYHPDRGWVNYWWGLTRSEDGVWGWVPEVFFRGGAAFEPDFGLRACPEPGEDDPCATSPVATGLDLRAHFKRRGHSGQPRRAVTIPFGHRAHVAGRLAGGDGSPIAGASICVATKSSASSAGRRDLGTILTNESGRFKYKAPRGPSRRLWFVHRSSGASAVATVLIRVRSGLTLSAEPRSLRNGESVVLSGRLRGRPRRGGVLVEMQAARGHRWQTFGTARTHRGGRFRFTYRFSRTSGVQVYELRAHVPTQRGHAYTAGSSHPVRIKVKG